MQSVRGSSTISRLASQYSIVMSYVLTGLRGCLKQGLLGVQPGGPTKRALAIRSQACLPIHFRPYYIGLMF